MVLIKGNHSVSRSPNTRQCWLSNEEECCDICGNIGFEDALLTCIQCKTNSEHMYCMDPVLEERIDDWRCEECEPINKPNPITSILIEKLPVTSKLADNDVTTPHAKSRKLLNESKKASFNWEKKVATGKTKYISAKESIMLLTKESPTAVSQLKSPQPKIGANRTNVVPRPFPQLNPQRLGNRESFERKPPKSKKLTELLQSASSLRHSQEHMEKQMQKEQSVQDKRLQPKERNLKKLSYASPVTVSGADGRNPVQQRTCNTENVNNNILPDAEIYSYTPSFDALWKGSFSIQDDHRRKELNHRIQAHSPSLVRKKIYEFSKQMPKSLHFELVPSEKMWINLFQEYIPDERDIGLYFFPSGGDRSEDYVSLMESMSVRKLALRKQIGDVELLVFSSKLLPVNCQCWEGKYFLWGVFRHHKRDVGPTDDVNQGVIDMDIDMIGGVNVGRMDVPIRRESQREKCENFGQESASSTVPGPEKQIKSIPRRDLDPVAVVSSLKIVKVGPHYDVPPGFEEKAKDKITGFPDDDSLQFFSCKKELNCEYV